MVRNADDINCGNLIEAHRDVMPCDYIIGARILVALHHAHDFYIILDVHLDHYSILNIQIFRLKRKASLLANRQLKLDIFILGVGYRIPSL